MDSMITRRITRRHMVQRSLALGSSTLVLTACGSSDDGGLSSLVDSVVGPLGKAAPENSRAPTPTPTPTFSWKPLRIGAGGWLTGIDIAADGTKVIRTDTSGAYRWSDAKAQWVPLLTTKTMPTGTYGFGGAYEIAVAHSNSSRIYVLVDGSLFRSDNGGTAFTRTALTGLNTPASDNYRGLGRKMSVDPRNPDFIVLGTAADGAYTSTDGGATWRSRTEIAKAQSGAGMRVAFDPSAGASARVFVASQGVGVYVSTDGGGTFTLTPGGPVNVQHMVVDQGGTLWATEGQDGNNLRKFASGSWSAVSAQGGSWCTIAVDPANVNHLVLGTSGGSLAQSLDHGATWSYQAAGSRTATDIPWLAWTNESYMTNGEMCFDPSASNKLFFAEGIGVWTTSPTGGAFTWTSQSRGIEQLVSNQLVAPPGGAPLYLAWDRPIFRLDDPNTYPKTHGPGNADEIVMGWGADYAPDDPKTIVALINWSSWPSALDRSGISTDGGITWTPFGSIPAEIPAGKIGGSIAAGSRTNFMILPSNNGTPWYTKDGGKNWARSNVPGVPQSGETGWGWGYFFHRYALVADRVALNTFYLYNYAGASAGVYRSTDGGENFTRVFTGEVADWSSFNARLYTVPGKQGHLFFTSGQQSSAYPAFMRSTDGGATWQQVPNVAQVYAAGFGAPASGQTYPSIYIAGYFYGKFSIYRSDNNAVDWTDLGAAPNDNGDTITTISGDPSTYGKVYVGFSGSGGAYGSIS